MRHEDVEILPDRFQRMAMREFRSLSKDEANSVYCLSENLSVGQMKAIDFDTFTEKSYCQKGTGSSRLPRSVDSLFFHGQDAYAIEFKNGNPDNLDLVRKIYDTVMCLTEHVDSNFNYAWARRKLTYLVVCSDERVQRQITAVALSGRVDAYKRTSQDEERVCRRFENLQALTGVLVSRFKALTPEGFDIMANKEGWK